MNKKNVLLLTLFLIMIIGVIPRFYHLGYENVWIDECFSLKEAERLSFWDALISIKEENTNPPFSFLFIRYWIMIFGDSDFRIRFPFALMGTISIIVIYFVGKELFNSKVGLVSSIIMSLSMVHVLYSQEARPYAIFTLTTLLSLLYYIRIMKYGKFREYTYYIIPTIIFLYTHYFSIFTLFMQNIVFFLYYKRFKVSIRNWFCMQSIIAFSCIPILWFLKKQFNTTQIAIFGQFTSKYGFMSVFSEMGVLLVILPVLIILFSVAIIKITKFDILHFFRKIGFNRNIFLVFAGILLLLSALVLSRVTSSIFIFRYSHFIYPIFYILFAKGFIMLKKQQKTILTISFILVSSFLLFNYHFDVPRKAEWKNVATLIESDYKEGELIIMLNKITSVCLNHYYSGNNLDVVSLQAYSNDIKNQEELSRLIANNDLENRKGVWLILSHAHNTRGFYRKYLNNSRNHDFKKVYKSIDVYHFS